jgi:hypothetical protein
MDELEKKIIELEDKVKAREEEIKRVDKFLKISSLKNP